MGSSPLFPSDRHCRDHCPGLRAVLPSWKEYQKTRHERGEPVLTPKEWLWATFDLESSPLTSRIAWAELQHRMDHLW